MRKAQAQTMLVAAVAALMFSHLACLAVGQMAPGYMPPQGVPQAQVPHITPGHQSPPGMPPVAGPKPSMADQVEAVLAKNPLAVAWNSVRHPKRAPAPQPPMQQHPLPGAPVQPQFDPLALGYQQNRMPSPDLFTSAAQLSERQGQLDRAREQFRQALAIAPNNVDALLGFARLEDRQGNLAEAEQMYGQAVRVNPVNTTALNDLALCLARQGKLDQAAGLLQQAANIQPDKALYRNNLATVLVELDRAQEALAHLSAVHGPAVGNFNVGHLLAKRGRKADAAVYLTAALEIDPSMTQAREGLAALDQDASTSQVATTQTAEQPAPAVASRPAVPNMPARPAMGQPMPRPAGPQLYAPVPGQSAFVPGAMPAASGPPRQYQPGMPQMPAQPWNAAPQQQFAPQVPSVAGTPWAPRAAAIRKLPPVGMPPAPVNR